MPRRKIYEGAYRVVRFNWPLYAVALAGTAALAAAPRVLTPGLKRTAAARYTNIFAIICNLLALLITMQTILSTLASHWVYDRSPLKDWRWLEGFMPPRANGRYAPLNIINVHSGYDEASAGLLDTFKEARVRSVDLYPALGRREPSIIRARQLYPPPFAPIAQTIANWPVEADSVDLVLVAFAAHELRQREQRELLFRQAKAVLKKGGKVILVEHLRDPANLLAFSVGFFHFFSRAEWLLAARAAGLILVAEERITPLVGVFTFSRLC